MHWTYTNYYDECRSLVDSTPEARIVFLHYNVLIYSLHAAVLYGFRFGLLFRSRDCPGASDDGSKSVKAVVNLHRRVNYLVQR